MENGHFRTDFARPLSKEVASPDADVARERRCRHGERAGQVQFSWPGPPLEIAVDGGHRHLVGRDGNAGSCTDAGAAAGIDEFHADLKEEVMPPVSNGQILDLTRAVLDVEVNPVFHAQARCLGRLADFGVVGDVVFLSSRARAAVSDVDGHFADVTDVGAVGGVAGDALIGVAGMGNHRHDGREVNGVNAAIVVSSLVRSDHAGSLFGFRKVRLCLHHPRHQGIIGFANARSARTLRCHVAQRGPFVDRK